MKDAHLHRTITKHCVHNFESITPEIKDLVVQHEPSAWILSKELQEKRKKEMSAHAKTKEREYSLEGILEKRQEELESVVGLVNGDNFQDGLKCQRAELSLECQSNETDGTNQYRLTCKCCNSSQLGYKF